MKAVTVTPLLSRAARRLGGTRILALPLLRAPAAPVEARV
jgi:hypothetical protein